MFNVLSFVEFDFAPICYFFSFADEGLKMPASVGRLSDICDCDMLGK